MRRGAVGALVALGLLVGAEGVLRWADVAPGSFPSPLAFQAVPTATVTTDGAVRHWPFGRPRAALATPPGLRIMLLGESAAEGDAYTPWASMGGVMERTLRASLPEPVEVLNFGTPGVGSRHLAAFLDAALAVERPGALVLYLGNNELHELRALKAASPHYDARSELLRRRLWTLRSYRLLATWLRPQAAPAAAAQPLRDMAATADADDRALAMTLFAENLDQMLDAAAAAHVPVVLAVVAVNERSWHDGADAAETAAYQNGLALLASGDRAGGRAEILRGESIASRPMRALPEARDRIRAAATTHSVTLCDIDAMLSAAAPEGVNGEESFADACHPNLAGHAQIGALLAQCVLDATNRAAPLVPAPLVPDPARLDRWTGRREPALPDDGSAIRAFERGHQAFLLRDYPGAAAAWKEAVARGGSPAALHVNEALLALHAGDLTAARAGLSAAIQDYPDDPTLPEMVAALTPRAGATPQP